MTSGRGQPTVREAVFDFLRSCGLTTIFGNPGSTELPMFHGLPDDFRYVLGLQESVVVGMADGYAKATGRAAVASLHSAAGVGHAMGNIFTAYRGRAPLVIISGQQDRSMLTGEPYLYSEDAATLPRPYVKWSREPGRAEDVPAAIARAYYVATCPPQGPALVSVPVDDWARPARAVTGRRVSTALRPDPADIAQVGEALAAARRPAFVAGAAIDHEGAFAEVVRLAEMHRAAVWAPPMSWRCGFPESHPLFAGFLPPMRAGIAECLKDNDVVLVLGAPAFTYHVASPGPPVPAAAQLFQLTDDPQQASWTPVGTSVLTSVKPGLLDLLGFPPTRERDAPSPRGRPRRIAAEAAEPISAGYLVQTIADMRPPGSVIVEEAPSTRPVMCEYLPNNEPESFYTCASGGLGYSLPAAVGMALARPERRVIAIIGDGAMMYSIQALWSATRLDVASLTIIVVNNGSYATLHGFARKFGIDRAVGSDLGNLDFAGLARAQGCLSSRVECVTELPGALHKALDSSRPYLVDVHCADRTG